MAEIAEVLVSRQRREEACAEDIEVWAAALAHVVLLDREFSRRSRAA
jgi:hypothetical protein